MDYQIIGDNFLVVIVTKVDPELSTFHGFIHCGLHWNSLVDREKVLASAIQMVHSRYISDSHLCGLTQLMEYIRGCLSGGFWRKLKLQF